MLIPANYVQDKFDIGPFIATQEFIEALAAGDLDSLIESPEDGRKQLTGLTAARVLLDNTSTAIMHFPLEPVDPVRRSVLVGVNYDNGHSEGDNTIVVQDPINLGAGQWMMRTDRDDKTFYRRMSLFGGGKYPAERSPTNPEKIQNYWMHSGDPREIRASFEDLGYIFTNDPAPDSHRMRGFTRYFLHD